MGRTGITVLLLLFSYSAGFAATAGNGAAWQTALKEAVNKGNLGAVMGGALSECVAPEEIMKAGLAFGYNPYELIKAGFNPGVCPEGCVCGIIRGAAAAGITPAVITKAAVDAGVDPVMVERGLAPPLEWQADFERTLKERGLGQAVGDAVGQCVPPNEVVTTAIGLGQKPYLAIRATLNSSGGGCRCLCEIVDGAMAAGVTPVVVSRAAHDSCDCQPEEAGLGYTPVGEGRITPPPLPPPPPVSASRP